MMILLEFFLLLIACGLLITLSVIDLRTWLLPDPLNLALACTGILFHFVIHFQILPPHDLIFGALLGAGLLYILRLGGNAYYKQESLGLGDVKLLGAAGLWLGLEGTVIAIILGAAAGIVHGIIFAIIRSKKTQTPFSLKRLLYPAGPGFCVGILLAGLYEIGPYFGLHP